MNYTKSVGNIVELKCLIAFMKMGFDCSIPYGDNAKYDIIVDIGDELLKIQCKSANAVRSEGKIDENAFIIRCTSQTTNTKKTIRHSYVGLIDYFATVWKDKVYLIPVDECSDTKTLRLNPPKYNVTYNKAEDYEIEKILGHKVSPIFVQEKQEIKDKKENNNNSNSIPKFFCIKCGINTVSKKDTMCLNCYHLNNRKVERPSKEELKKFLIQKIPFIRLGKIFGVSDNAIRKWCKSYNLPYKSSEIKKLSLDDWDLL